MRFAPSSDIVPGSAAEAAPLELSFAGIHFAFEGPSALLQAMAGVPLALRLRDLPANGVEARGLGAELAGAPVARVACSLRSTADGGGLAPAELGSRGVAWEWAAGVGHAVTRHATACWESSPAGFRAEAKLSSSPRAAESLLTALASALLHQAGGAILHAASVELPSGVVAFVGPSGAGKSTACEHVNGARQFSLDRLAVVPMASASDGRGGWVAHPLPGGTRSERGLPDAIALGRPLRAILEIHKLARGCQLTKCSESKAVARLRASAFHANQRPEAELELLANLERLAREVPIADLHLSLGTSLGPILSRWLVDVDSARGFNAGHDGEWEERHVGA